MKPQEHELILKEVAKCVYESNWAIYEENGKNHISGRCFLSDLIEHIVIGAVKDYVSESDTESVVGFSEGADQAAITVATIVGYKLAKPLFAYIMSDEDSLRQRIGGKTCSLILVYTSSEQQIKDVLRFIERQDGIVKQAVAFLVEKDEPEDVFTSKHIQFESLSHLDEIIKSLETLEVPSKEDLNHKIELLRC